MYEPEGCGLYFLCIFPELYNMYWRLIFKYTAFSKKYCVFFSETQNIFQKCEEVKVRVVQIDVYATQEYTVNSDRI